MPPEVAEDLFPYYVIVTNSRLRSRTSKNHIYCEPNKHVESSCPSPYCLLFLLDFVFFVDFFDRFVVVCGALIAVLSMSRANWNSNNQYQGGY